MKSISAVKKIAGSGLRTTAKALSASIAVMISSNAMALEWDADSTTPGVQGGSGLWNGGTNWWNGTQNVPWMDGSFASFTGLPQGTIGWVDVGGMSVNGLSVSGRYTLSQGANGGALTLLGNTINTSSILDTVTISVPLAGSQGLRKLGPGTLWLTGANTYTGDTVVEMGVLTARNGQALPDSGSVKIESGASLVVGMPESIDRLTGSGSVVLNSALTVGVSGGSSSFAGSLVGVPEYSAISLVKDGAGTLTLSGTNSYTGQTRINQGILEVSGGNAMADTGMGLIIGANGALRLLSNETVSAINGEGTIQLGANTLTLNQNSFYGSLYNGRISGTGELIIRGEGSLWGSSDFTGAVKIAGGMLHLQTIANKGISSELGAGNAIIFEPGSGSLFIEGSNASSSDRAIVINGSQANIRKAGAGQLTLTGEIGGSGALNIEQGNVSITRPSNTFAGGVIIKSGSVTVSDLKDTGVASSLGVGGTITLGVNHWTDSDGSGRLVLSDAGSSATNRQVILQVGGGVIQTSPGSVLTITGSMTGAGALAKEGEGVLSLSAANTYAGATVINGGKLVVTGGFAIPDVSVVILGKDGALQLLGSEVIGGLNGTGAIDLGANRLTVNNGPIGTFTGTVTGSGSLVIKGGGLLTLSGESSFTGGVEITGRTVSIPYLKNSGEFSALGTSGTITLGDDSGSGTLSVREGISDRPFTLGAKGAVISVDAKDLVLSGPVRGDGTLIKTGLGVLVLENVANSFSGDATVNNGTLSVTAINDRGVAGPLGTGAAIKLSGGTLHFKGIGEHSSNRSLLYTSSSRIAVEQGATLVLESASGTGGFQKLGAGILIQRDPLNSFAGEVRVTEGILETGALANAGLASALGAGNRIVLDGGQLSLPTGVDGSTNREIVASGGRIQIADSRITLNGLISGAGSLTLVGNGVENAAFHFADPSINGQSTHTGTLRFEGVSSNVPRTIGLSDYPKVELVNSHLVFAQKGYVGSLGGGAESIGSRVTLAEGLYVSGLGSGEFAGVIEGIGGLESRGYAGLLGENTFTGDVSLFGGTIAVPFLAESGAVSPLGTGAAVRFFEGNYAAQPRLRITGATSSASNRTLSFVNAFGAIDVVNAAAMVILSGQVNGDAASRLTKEGLGTLRLSGANGFTGSIHVQGGKLEVSGGNALPNQGNVAVTAGAKFEVLFGSAETIGSLEGAGGVILGARLITGGSDRSSTFSGLITGTGTSPLVKRGSGTFTLTHIDSSFTGGMHIADGAVSVPTVTNSGLNSPLGRSGRITLGDEESIGRLIFTHHGVASTDRPFLLMSGGGALDVSNRDAELELTGPIEGDGALLKLGSGRLRIASDTGFSAGIVVGGGILDLVGNMPGVVTVLNPAIVETTGDVVPTIRGLTLAGGMIALSGTRSAGSLNVGDLLLESGTFEFDLEQAIDGYDQLKVSGSVRLEGYVALTINLGVDPEDFSDVYRLVLNNGTDITAVFDDASRFVYQGNVLEEGETFLVTSGNISQYFQMHYGLTPEDNDIRIVAAPEPGSALLLATGAVGLLGLRRRRA